MAETVDNLKRLAQKLASDVQVQIKVALAEEWEQVTDQTKDDIKRTAQRLGELTLKEYMGDDVATEKAVVLSSINDWKVSGKFKTAVLAEKAESAMEEGFKRIGSALGGFFGSLGRGVLKGATGI